MEAGAWERYGEVLEIAEKDAEYLKMQKDFLKFEKQFHEYAVLFRNTSGIFCMDFRG